MLLRIATVIILLRVLWFENCAVCAVNEFVAVLVRSFYTNGFMDG